MRIIQQIIRRVSTFPCNSRDRKTSGRRDKLTANRTRWRSWCGILTARAQRRSRSAGRCRLRIISVLLLQIIRQQIKRNPRHADSAIIGSVANQDSAGVDFFDMEFFVNRARPGHQISRRSVGSRTDTGYRINLVRLGGRLIGICSAQNQRNNLNGDFYFHGFSLHAVAGLVTKKMFRPTRAQCRASK